MGKEGMNAVAVTIDGKAVQVSAGATILKAAVNAGIYIPTLCHHPDLPPVKGIKALQYIYQGERRIENAHPHEKGKGCGLCVVEIDGESELIDSCATPVAEGMVITTNSDRVKDKRRKTLIPILARHRHACLTCAQQEGCSGTQCSSNVPENERCCDQFGHCELQNVSNYIGISNATPKGSITDFAVITDDPLYKRDYNLCIGCTRCVRACRDLKGIEAIGFVYDSGGRVQVGTPSPTLFDSGCKFCTACVEVCPTGALTDKGVEAGKRDEDLVPCKAACPVHIDIPAYVRMIAEGKADEANAVIREKVPFPGILGRICIHPCEMVCRRGEVSDPIAICALERYASEREKGLWKKGSRVGMDTGKQVAIVGSGPAGLTTAFYLKKKGYCVTVFESSSRAGGMMRYGIPAYRLPPDILEKEIKNIFDLGIDFKPNVRIGKNITLDQLKTDGFDAVFLGIGAQVSRSIPMEGSDLPDILWGVDFLRDVSHGKPLNLKENVLVIGGGNVAIDAALTALRLGAKEVSMACLESKDEMPADKWKIESAVSEGVRLLPAWGPYRILSENGRITGMNLVECTCVFDEKGNFYPQFGDQKESIPVNQIIMAVGQATDLTILPAGTSIAVREGLIVVNQETLETGMKGVYAGGDVTKATGAVIMAIADGRKAAAAIDKALGGTGDIEEVLFDKEPPSQRLARDEHFALWERVRLPEIPINVRHHGFAEVVVGYDDEEARQEARRCLQCDLRLFITCNPAPPEHVKAFNLEAVLHTPETEGVYRLFNADKNVIVIKGTPNLKEELLRKLDKSDAAAYFEVEEDKMYSKRESELIQRYLREHGRMPGGGGEEEDLF